jgi:hypothetical protein
VPRATLTTKSGASAALGNVRICPRFHWRWICSEVSTNLGWRNSASCNCQATVSTCQAPSITHPSTGHKVHSNNSSMITDTMAKGPSWDATSSSAGREIPKVFETRQFTVCMSPPSARLIHYNASPSRFFKTPLPLSSQQHTWLHTHLKWNSYMLKNCFNKLQQLDIRRNVSACPRASSPYTTERFNPSAWRHLNRSSYCDVGRLFYGVFKLWSKLQRKKWRNNF